MYTNIEEIRGKKVAIESELTKYRDAIDYKLAKGEFDVDNMCARVDQLERLLMVILNRLARAILVIRNHRPSRTGKPLLSLVAEEGLKYARGQMILLNTP